MSMLPSAFRFEAKLSAEAFEKLGRLSMRWSHIDHMIANCLKILLRLNDNEAIVMVFPLSTEIRLTRMRELEELKAFPTESATIAFRELRAVMKGIQVIRNNVVHAVIMGKEHFELRSKQRVRQGAPLRH